MESTTSIGFFIAFSAGVLSFLSPCVLPLIPSYLSFITGMSLEEMGDHRRAAVTHALLFVSGFTLIFLMLGATATGLGRLVNFQQVWLERIGGILIIFFGLYLLGVFQWGALLRERRVHIQNKPLGYLGSVMVGVAFGAGWTPCIGPVLAGLLVGTLFSGTLTTVGTPRLWGVHVGVIGLVLNGLVAIAGSLQSRSRTRLVRAARDR